MLLDFITDYSLRFRVDKFCTARTEMAIPSRRQRYVAWQYFRTRYEKLVAIEAPNK